MKKLPKAFKEKWLAALRSGKYKQGERKLKEGDSYCCLGVACVVADRRIRDGFDTIIPKYSKKIPSAIRGACDENNVVEILTSMNDGTGGTKKRSFLYIADYIEKNL